MQKGTLAEASFSQDEIQFLAQEKSTYEGSALAGSSPSTDLKGGQSTNEGREKLKMDQNLIKQRPVKHTVLVFACFY